MSSRGSPIEMVDDRSKPGVLSDSSFITTRFNQPYKRKEFPMSLDTCISRTHSSWSSDCIPQPNALDVAPVELSRPTATVGAEPSAVWMGWFPESRARLGHAQRRPYRRGEGIRTSTRRVGSPSQSVGVPLAGGVRTHLKALLRAGFAMKDLVSLTGLSRHELGEMLRSNATHTSQKSASRVMSVQFHPIDDGRRKTPAIGAKRRLQALAALGFSLESLAARVHRSVAEVEALHHGGLITRRLWFTISELYDELSMTASAPDEGVRDWARHEMGWPPPLAWDDDEIDDPRAHPHNPSGCLGVDEVAIKRCVDGDNSINLSPDEVQVILGMSEKRGWSRRALADVLGTSEDAAARRLVRYRQRMRINDSAADVA